MARTTAPRGRKRGPGRLSREEATEVFRRFAAKNPDPRGELHYQNPFTLLVAVVLSAQSNRRRRQQGDPGPVCRRRHPEKMAALGEDKITGYIKTIGLYRGKARNLAALSRKLVAEHGGKVPDDRAALEELPASAARPPTSSSTSPFGSRPSRSNTHIFRVSNRTGLAPGRNPSEVEQGPRADRAGPVQAPCPSLVDPARPLYLRRAEAEMP